MIEIKNISKKFDTTLVIDGLSLDIPEGGRLVILGHSGCGKTTLLRLIAGFERPDKGEIWINGARASSPRAIIPPSRRNIGMVFQNLALWPHLRIEENIGFGLKNPAGKIDAILRAVDLIEKRRSYPARLSGGEQQRVALARALIQKPKILLMDEPLANLDHKLREQMIDMLLSLQRQFKITLVYVTHDPAAARLLGERIVLMNQGQVEMIKKGEKFAL